MSGRLPPPGADDAAIVGLGLRLPGATTADAFWRNLRAGLDASREVPSGRWALAPERCAGGAAGEADRVVATRGYFLDEDALAYADAAPVPSAAARELAGLDPMLALTLAAAGDALAGGVLARLTPERTAVVVGNLALPTESTARLMAEGAGDPRCRQALALPALVVARAFGFSAGALSLDAACASSLYALALAVEALREGRADAVVCGGVSRPDALYTQMGFSQLRALAADGTCRPFDARGQGLVVGEGAGLFVVKRLADALRAGDEVLGVVRGVGIGNDRGGALLAPDAAGQLGVMRAAYAAAGWLPWDVDAVEAHATGTPLGDRVEAESLARLWAEAPAGARAVLGSAKGHVGHLLTAAGATSLAKVLLSMRHGEHAPTANFERPIAALQGGRFDVLAAARPWAAADGRPRRAAVSGFGFGGINAHVLIEEWRGGVVAAGGGAGSGSGAVAVVAASRQQAPVPALPMRLRIPPREAEAMLPQQATMLLAAEAALKAARERGEGAAMERVGVFVGLALDDATSLYSARWRAIARGSEPTSPPLTADRTVGSLASIVASRIAKGLGCEGPAFVVSAGEQSGLAALDLAAAALRRGEIDAAVVGAVDGGGAIAVVLMDAAAARRERREILREVAAPAEQGPHGAWRGWDAEPTREATAVLAEWLGGSVMASEQAEPVKVVHGTAATVTEIDGRLAALARGESVDDAAANTGAHPWRWSLVVKPDETLAAAADSMRRGLAAIDPQSAVAVPRRIAPRAFLGHAGAAPKVAFLYPGSGSHYAGMGQELRAAYPEIWRREALAGLWPEVRPGDARAAMSAQCAFGIFATAILRAHGIVPDAAIGYSLGESAALLALGAWPDREAVFARLMSSPLFADELCGERRAVRRHWGVPDGEPVDWVNALVRRSADEVRRVLPQRAYLCNVNSPVECVLGGDRSAVVEALRRLDHALYEIPDMPALHAPVAGAAGEMILDFHRFETETPAGVTFYGGARGEPYPATSDAAARAIMAHALEGVSFPQVVERAYADGVRIFVEIGPGASLTRMVGDVLGTRPHARLAVAPGAGQELVGLACAQALMRTIAPAAAPATAAPVRAASPKPWLDRAACETFARGRIGDVLGARFAPVDAFPSRVRLPDGPLMLCHRIMSVEGEPLSLGAGRLITEHDVEPGAWYLDGGRIPTSVAVESGQADLFLSAYLGADFATEGRANYRLLDAVVEFHDRLPAPGAVIRYDIRIDRFFRQGGTLFFHFRFEATADGKPLMSMRDGCAGFFTPAALAEGRGVVRPRLEAGSARAVAGAARFVPPAPIGDAPEAYDAAGVDALRRGDYAACFGEAFAGLALQRPKALPDGMLRLVHRIVRLEARGGRHGLGFVVGEADIKPDDWFLTCHFIDDQVMPGTLMYECCNHTLRVLLMRLGWVGEEAELATEPMTGVPARLKCRGQVLPTTACVRYEIEVKEIGYGPDAYAVADAVMLADGKPIVEITNLSLRHAGFGRERVEKIWGGRRIRTYNAASIRAFAEGKPSEAFGERYRIFDDPAGRRIARLPRAPFLFVDRVTPIDAQPWEMRAGGRIVAAWDVPPDAWFFAPHGAVPRMPFAVLLEAVLQPCGWMSGYMGSALTSNEDLSYRNLGGRATLHQAPTAASGTLTTEVTCTKVSASGGMILQSFTFAMRDARGALVYDGETMFGFFSKAALAQQVGLRDPRAPAATAAGGGNAALVPYPDKPHLPRAPWLMLDGFASFGRDRAHAVKLVDPREWFFEAHFYQDPVMPGSLGLESLQQAALVMAEERWPRRAGGYHALAAGSTHEWTYRGQVLPTARRVDVHVEVEAVDDARQRLTVGGWLLADGLAIYRLSGFTLAASDA